MKRDLAKPVEREDEPAGEWVDVKRDLATPAQREDEPAGEWVAFRRRRDTSALDGLFGQGMPKPAANSAQQAPNSTSEHQSEFKRYLQLYLTAQDRLITLAYPVISGIANRTNDPFRQHVIWQAFAEVVAVPLKFHSPFKAGGNYIDTVEKQLFNGSSAHSIYAKANRTIREDRLLDFIEDLDSLYLLYKIAYQNATAAANVTGLLPKLKTLGGYLLPEDKSIMAEGFNKTNDYWINRLFPNGTYGYSNSTRFSVFIANSTA